MPRKNASDMLFEQNAVTSLRPNSRCYHINSSLHAVLNSCMRQSGIALGNGCGSESAYLQRCSPCFFCCFFSRATLSSYHPTTTTTTTIFPFPHASTHTAALSLFGPGGCFRCRCTAYNWLWQISRLHFRAVTCSGWKLTGAVTTLLRPDRDGVWLCCLLFLKK